MHQIDDFVVQKDALPKSFFQKGKNYFKSFLGFGDGTQALPSRQEVAEKMFFFYLQKLDQLNEQNPLFLYDLVQSFFFSKTKRYYIEKEWTKLKVKNQTAEVGIFSDSFYFTF